jgi:hypothetical protein
VTWILARRSDRDGIHGYTVQKIDAKAVRRLPNCNVYVPAGYVRFTSTRDVKWLHELCVKGRFTTSMASYEGMQRVEKAPRSGF